MPSSRRYSALTLILVFSLAGLASASLPEFDAQSYLRHVKYLSSDALEGRGDGTPGLEKAADYNRRPIQGFPVLLPAGRRRDLFSELPGPGRQPVGDRKQADVQDRPGNNRGQTQISISFPSQRRTRKRRTSAVSLFLWGTGSRLRNTSTTTTRTSMSRDKVVLLLTHEPRENDPTSPFEGTELTCTGTTVPRP